MDSVKSNNESPFPVGRITTDAIQRRFRSDRKQDSNESKSKGSEEDYFCTECNQKLQDSEEELKTHFEEVEHKSHSVCGSCSKPIYAYMNKKKTKFYHICKYLKKIWCHPNDEGVQLQ